MVDIQTRQQIWKDLGGNLTEKAAELANTYDMPAQSAPSKRRERGGEKAVIKNASANDPDEILKEAFGAQEGTPTNTGSAIQPDTNIDEHMPDQPADVPQAKALKPRVDVSGKEPPKAVVKKEASYYALPSQGRYPLDSYGDVEKAAAYFDEWHPRMNPGMRREFCQNMVKRASALSIPVSELAQRYASDHWAPEEQVKIAMDARRTALIDEGHQLMLDKLDGQRRLMTPDDFAATLGEFDKLAGLNHHYDVDIPDPYFSCMAKVAMHPTEAAPDKTIIIGNEVLPERKLVELSHASPTVLKERFGDDFVKEFEKDPKGIFDSLPRDQKLVLMRMASTMENPRTGASVG